MSMILIAVLIIWNGLVEIATAQHIHDDHPITMHHGYFRASLEGPGHSNPSVKLDSNGNYMIFNEWLINSTCGEVDRGNMYLRSVTHRVHVSIEGEVEWGAEAGAKVLAAELKTYSKARVQLNGGWSGEWKEQLSFSSNTTLKKCQKVWYVFLKNRRTASGHIYTWEHKMTCINPATLDIAYTYCDKRKLKGTGLGWGTHIGEHVQRGLVSNCPCKDIDPDTVHVFHPSVPVTVPDPSPSEEEQTNGPPAPEPEPEWILQNPLNDDAADNNVEPDKDQTSNNDNNRNQESSYEF